MTLLFLFFLAMQKIQKVISFGAIVEKVTFFDLKTVTTHLLMSDPVISKQPIKNDFISTKITAIGAHL